MKTSQMRRTSRVPLSEATSQNGNWNGKSSNVGRGKTGGYLAPLHNTALRQTSSVPSLHNVLQKHYVECVLKRTFWKSAALHITQTESES